MCKVEGQAVEGRGGRGEAQRALRDVGRGDAGRMRRQVQRLHPAAGAEVERRADVVADGRLRQRRRRATDPEHVVGRQRHARAQRRRQVGEHPPVAVRLQLHTCAHTSPVGNDDAGAAREAERKRGRDHRLRLRLAADEQPDQGGERVAVPGGAQRRAEVVALDRLHGGVAEAVGDALAGVAGRGQRRPQVVDAVLVQERLH